jgi:hypothetical protein
MFRALPRVAATLAIVSLFATFTAPQAWADDEAGTMTMARLGLDALDTARTAGTPPQAALFPVAPLAAAEQVRPMSPLRPVEAGFSSMRRPALLPALYAANVALQALDAHSTLTALDLGAREANPVMQGVVGNKPALLAVKAGAAVGTIYFAEKLWRRNRVGAVVMMVIVNGVTTAIVAHNYRVADKMR